MGFAFSINRAVEQDKEAGGNSDMKMPGDGLMAGGKSVRDIIKALAEAGQDNWCGGRSH